MRVPSKRYVFVYKVEDQRGFMMLNQDQREGEGERRSLSERERRECIGVTRETLDHLFKNEKIIVLKKDNVRTFSKFDDDRSDQGEAHVHTYLCIYLHVYTYTYRYTHVLLYVHKRNAQLYAINKYHELTLHMLQ